MAIAPRLLSDVDPDEVSLVAKPANKRRFLLRKAAEVNLDPELVDIISVAAENEGAMLDLVRKSGGDETAQTAVAFAMRALSGVELAPEVVEKLGKQLYPRENPPLNSRTRSNGGGGDGEDSELNEVSEDEEGDDMDEVAVGKTKKDPDNDGDDDSTEAGDTDEDMEKSAKEPYGNVTYADPGYQSDKKKRYPIDTEEHIRAAWSYINKPANAAKYPDGKAATVKSRIRAAMKRIGADVSKSDSEQEKGARVDSHTGPVQKEDGTWDFSGVPAENRAYLEAVQKQAEETASALESAKAEIKKADERASELESKLRTKELVQKAEDEFGKVGPAEDVAEILKAAEGFDEATREKLEKILKAANAKIEAGDLFSELGTKFSGSKGSTGAYAEAVAKADEMVQKGDSDNRATAMGKVWETNPGLYERYLAENPAQTNAFGTVA